MSTVTYRGQLPTGQQERLHLSTNNGLTGYRIKKFNIISSQPGDNYEYVVKVRLTSDDNVGATVNFNDPSIVAVAYFKEGSGTNQGVNDIIIMDSETFNQDVFITAADASGNTIPVNYYLELEKMKLDLNASTFSTLKNIRQDKADNLV